MANDRCRSCGAEIIWVKTVAGKSMPIDATPSDVGTVQILPGQTCTVLSKADAAKVRDMNNKLENTTTLYVSHFATCVNAASHRKPGA